MCSVLFVVSVILVPVSANMNPKKVCHILCDVPLHAHTLVEAFMLLSTIFACRSLETLTHRARPMADLTEEDIRLTVRASASLISVMYPSTLLCTLPTTLPMIDEMAKGFRRGTFGTLLRTDSNGNFLVDDCVVIGSGTRAVAACMPVNLLSYVDASALRERSVRYDALRCVERCVRYGALRCVKMRALRLASHAFDYFQTVSVLMPWERSHFDYDHPRCCIATISRLCRT